MPIEILTGKPGNAKTAFLVDMMLTERAKENPRFIVAMGINGLVDGVADLVIDDPTKWAEITDRTQGPCTCPLIGGAPPFQPHTHRIPAGAIIYVDEAWKWFGHLQDARGAQTPKHALDLAEHRHMGVDFVWTAQGPNQIFPFVRNLIADHTHHSRRFNTSFVDTWKWEELQEDVKSEGKRAAALSAVKVIPKRTFGLYKSAQEHTMKAKIPWRVYAIPGILIAAVLFGWLAYTNLRPAALASKVTTEGPESPQGDPAHASPLVAQRGSKNEYLTREEYTALHLPRFETMPHTAPLFDARPPTSDPQLFCMASFPGETGGGEQSDKLTCTCLTEQGTKYDIPDGHCMRVARWGPAYNPYKERREEQVGNRSGPAQEGQGIGPTSVASATASIDAGSGAGGPAGRPAAYGGMRKVEW